MGSDRENQATLDLNGFDHLEQRIYDTLKELEAHEYVSAQGFDVIWTTGAIKRLAAEVRHEMRRE